MSATDSDGFSTNIPLSPVNCRTRRAYSQSMQTALPSKNSNANFALPHVWHFFITALSVRPFSRSDQFGHQGWGKCRNGRPLPRSHRRHARKAAGCACEVSRILPRSPAGLCRLRRFPFRYRPERRGGTEHLQQFQFIERVNHQRTPPVTVNVNASGMPPDQAAGVVERSVRDAMNSVVNGCRGSIPSPAARRH